MIRKLPLLLATALVLALSPGAFGIGVTGQLDSVVASIEARRLEFLAQKDRAGRRSARTLARAARFLKRRSVGRSLVGEIAGATRAAGLVEARFPDEAGILAGLNEASGTYEREVALGTLVLESQTQQQGLRRARLRILQRRLVRAQAGLADAAAAETLKARLAAQLRVARVTRNATLTGDAFSFVVATLSVADKADSFGNNALADAADALGDAGIDLDALLANAVFTSPQVVLIELWAVDDFAADSLVFAAAVEGVDNDGNPSDNFTGNETFIGSLEADGHAIDRTTTALAGGAYDIELEPSGLMLAGFNIGPGETLRIAATASATTNSGRFGLTVAPTELVELLTLAGEEVTLELFDQLIALADVDTDGDEQLDALSATLDFSSVRAAITLP